MLARMQKSMREKDRGFTLIELLVVIVIIGVLAAIAIPIFLNQRKKGVDASLESDLKSAATTVETYIVDNPSAAVPADTATNGTPGTGPLAELEVSDGNTVTLKPSAGTTGAYCIYAWNPGASDATSAASQLAYISQDGGLQPDPVTATTCA